MVSQCYITHNAPPLTEGENSCIVSIASYFYENALNERSTFLSITFFKDSYSVCRALC